MFKKEKKINWNEQKYFNGVGNFSVDIIEKNIKKDSKILDFGCGNGKKLSEVRLNDEHKYGLDPAEIGIEMAKKNNPEINYFVGTLEDNPFADNFFDLIYSVDVIEHIKNTDIVLSEINRILKKEGIVILQTPNYPIKRLYDFYHFINPKIFRKSIKDDSTHFTKFNYFKLRKDCSKYFEVIEIKVRNIFLENKFNIFKKIKNTPLGFLLGQKLIIICKKRT